MKGQTTKTKQKEQALSKPQQRMVLSLFQERQRILEQAQQALAEIDGAIRELAAMLCGAPLPSGAEPVFEPRGDQLVMIIKESPEPDKEG